MIFKKLEVEGFFFSHIMCDMSLVLHSGCSRIDPGTSDAFFFNASHKKMSHFLLSENNFKTYLSWLQIKYT